MTSNAPNLGVIEGFYGKAWSASSRLRMARWLPKLGFNSYLYAPKSDGALRKGWRMAWAESDRQQLGELATTCRGSGLAFYIGLSPYALYEAYGPKERQALITRVNEIADIGVSGLALLFDDMPGAIPDLAARQLEIIADTQRALDDHHLIVCPTYYSDDEILDRVFGQRPENYLEALCRGIDDATDIFWTGPAVCSRQISADHLAHVMDRCGRPIYLWDNYPVNDSKARSEHLYLDPLRHRTPDAAPWLRGHWCNAMNQPALSLSALASLPALYGVASEEDEERVLSLAGVTDALRGACQPLAALERDELSEAQLNNLKIAAQGGSMAAEELAGWLDGDYTFDPACLTD